MITEDSRNNYCSVIRIVDDNGALLEPEHLTIRPSLAAVQHSDNQEFYAQPGTVWSRVGYQRLGDGRRWWIIADYSGIVDPFADASPRPIYVAYGQLRQALAGDTSVNEVFVTKPKSFASGDRVRIENLNPETPTFVDVFVQGVDEGRGVIQTIPFVVPSAGIPTGQSRTSIVRAQQKKLTCPSLSRAMFECLDFGNPVNVLPED